MLFDTLKTPSDHHVFLLSLAASRMIIFHTPDPRSGKLMQFYSELEHSTIRRLYEQGLESIVRLVSKLEDRILNLEDLQLSDRAQTVETLSKQIKGLQQSLEQKSLQMIQVHQLNHALLLRVRELESCLEQSDDGSDNAIKRDSHNSNLPPSLDPPWQKPPRTRSLRKKSHRKPGGQLGHSGATRASSRRSRPGHLSFAGAMSALSIAVCSDRCRPALATTSFRCRTRTIDSHRASDG